MKLLITGGGGFVGSSLIVRLPKNYEIICLGHAKNYNELKKHVGENVKLVEGEITDKDLVNKLMKGVDMVLHLAGVGGTPVCLQDPINAVLTNVHGTNILVDSAIKNNVKKFIFASSYLAYSVLKERKIPFTEDMELQPDDFYGALKATGESVVMHFPNYIILRFSTVYGYGLGFGAQFGGLASRFIQSAYNSGVINIVGSGNQKYDLLHIDDLCEAIRLILESDMKNEIINLGSGKPVSLNELGSSVAEVFKNELGKNIKIINEKKENYKEWPDRWMSIEKAKKLLNWEPKISFYDGIKEVINKLK